MSKKLFIFWLAFCMGSAGVFELSGAATSVDEDEKSLVPVGEDGQPLTLYWGAIEEWFRNEIFRDPAETHYNRVLLAMINCLWQAMTFNEAFLVVKTEERGPTLLRVPIALREQAIQRLYALIESTVSKRDEFHRFLSYKENNLFLREFLFNIITKPIRGVSVKKRFETFERWIRIVCRATECSIHKEFSLCDYRCFPLGEAAIKFVLFVRKDFVKLRNAEERSELDAEYELVLKTLDVLLKRYEIFI